MPNAIRCKHAVRPGTVYCVYCHEVLADGRFAVPPDSAHRSTAVEWAKRLFWGAVIAAATVGLVIIAQVST